jgi:SAM-dependent methyltransferase
MGLAQAVAQIPAFLGSLVGEDIQRSITREYHRALRSGWHQFPSSVLLPQPCGANLPERVVELLLARLSYGPGASVLDVGHANSMECHRAMVRSLPGPRRLTGIDMAEPVYDVSDLYARSVRADICATGLADDTFDLVWCISSLEHIGMDNSGYGEPASEGSTAERALAEMLRVTRPGGSVLVTVPYGRYENHGWFRNLDESAWHGLLEPLRDQAAVHELYFGHEAGTGWARVDAEDLADVGYRDQRNAGAAGLAAAILEKQTGWL